MGVLCSRSFRAASSPYLHSKLSGDKLCCSGNMSWPLQCVKVVMTTPDVFHHSVPFLADLFRVCVSFLGLWSSSSSPLAGEQVSLKTWDSHILTFSANSFQPWNYEIFAGQRSFLYFHEIISCSYILGICCCLPHLGVVLFVFVLKFVCRLGYQSFW